MSERLTPEEVAIMIRARQIQRQKKPAADADISRICEAAGISRKTGYQWAEKHAQSSAERQKELEEKLAQLEAEHAKLKQDYDWVSFVNRGRQLAWEIHRVDELLAEKKSLSGKKARQKR